MASNAKSYMGITKVPTGIPGFDAMTNGGLPAHSATLIIGAPGMGKTIFALQTLACAAQAHGEPGIFVAFEESARKIVSNAASFGWNLPQLMRRKLFFIDARLPEEAVQSGSFEISGLLESIGARARKMKAGWVVFDAIDILIDLLPDMSLRRREILRLQHWLEETGLTCIITSKADALLPSAPPAHAYMAYMTECVINLDHNRQGGTLARTLTVRKYRGSGHIENSVPYLIGARGIELDPLLTHTKGYKIYTQRISTGIARLDNMLDGGFIRGSTTLVTGAPGTSKTTLAGKFAEAACARGERALYVCFDESGDEIVRNLGSVGIRLGRFVKNGLLRMHGIVSLARSADAQVVDILTQVTEHQPRVLILDPLSALARHSGESGVMDIVYRIVQQCKLLGISVFATSLVAKSDIDTETTEMNVSTIADTWIHLNYLVKAGERNRALTIVKSRGTGHSNQVRELILDDKAVSLADVYIEEGEVLMGTMRYQREQSAGHKRQIEHDVRTRERLRKEEAINDLTARILAQQQDLERLKREMALDSRQEERNANQRISQQMRTSKLRRADATAKHRKSG